MSSSDESELFADQEWDARYFGHIVELAEKNASRYESQTNELLKKRVLSVEFNGAKIEFKLTPKGCSFNTNDSHSQQNKYSWKRMGWGKSAKRRALPQYFAEAEASIIMDQEN
jgi:hypothetical protein